MTNMTLLMIATASMGVCLLNEFTHVHGFSNYRLGAGHLAIHNKNKIINNYHSSPPSLSLSNTGRRLYSSSTSKRISEVDTEPPQNGDQQTPPPPSPPQAIAEEEEKSEFIPKRAMDIYVNYVTRLWNETSTDSRKKIANQRAYHAIKQVHHLLEDGEEYGNIMNDQEHESVEDSEKRSEARYNLLNACNAMLDILGPVEEDGTAAAAIATDTTTIESSSHSTNGATNGQPGQPLKKHAVQMITPEMEDATMLQTNNSNDQSSNDKVSSIVDPATTMTNAVAVVDKEKKAPKKKKGGRSKLFGATMGAAVAGWVFSGNFLFTSLFTMMTILGQLEYYRMVMRLGIYPARKISVVGACAMFVTASCAPSLHQICLPVFASYAMMWFLTMRRKVSTIPEIATTFTGMFYLGYIPSFWVRIRLIQDTIDQPATLLRPIVGPLLDSIQSYAKSTFPYFSRFITSPITAGSVFIFWTWISIAFSDVGAYFMGRKYGKTKLGSIFPAAGAASPNKTVEGYLGGSLFCAVFATAGARIMQWPYWYLTGPMHGIILAFLGLVGDLTASMLKRDSGMKDFGDLLPEHGGIMDRVDSFVFTAPYSWIVCQFIIPALRARSRLAIP